jgi:4-hydroxy-tetrahydrodipicolinate reductase
MIVAPNMSLGVNVLFRLVSETARRLGDGYDVEIVETHHRHKNDAPSGTARRLIETLHEVRGSAADDERHGRRGNVGPRSPGEIGVHAVRGGDIVGDHTVVFAGPGERLELTHRATSREAFARGVLRAVRFAVEAKPGWYAMSDVLGLP